MFDDNSGVLLTRRRLLGGLTTIGVAGAASGAGTWAYFRDTEESTGNTIDAGTLDLTLSDRNEGFGDGVSETWTISDARPGGEEEVTGLTLANEGSLSADHLEIEFSLDERESDGSGGTNDADTMPSSAEGMAEQFVLTRFEYEWGTVTLDDLSDANENGIVDLGDLANGNDAVLDDLPAPAEGTVPMSMGFRWADDSEFDNSVSGANNDYQGDELDLTVTFTLHQDSSQDYNSSQES